KGAAYIHGIALFNQLRDYGPSAFQLDRGRFQRQIVPIQKGQENSMAIARDPSAARRLTWVNGLRILQVPSFWDSGLRPGQLFVTIHADNVTIARRSKSQRAHLSRSPEIPQPGARMPTNLSKRPLLQPDASRGDGFRRQF